MNKAVSSANLFRCLAYEDVFQNVYNSYNEKPYIKEMNLYGGSSSGKSIHIAQEIVFWLARHKFEEALVIVYSSRHKKETRDLFVSIIQEHHFNFKAKKDESHDIVINFGNKNKIIIRSVETSSIDKLEEKFKTGNTLKKPYKFVWFEEFTAILNSFRVISTFDSAKTRIKRLMMSNSVTFYTWNPPQNRNHLVYDWQKTFKGKNIKTTIFDLPKKWQDKETLEDASDLREVSEDRFQHLYLGNPVLAEGLAFDVNYNLFISDLNIADCVSFHIQTDEAIRNATAFCLYAWTIRGELVLVKTWYHSAKEKTSTTSFSTYADEFERFISEFSNITIDTITTDDPGFRNELVGRGFDFAKNIGRLKNRPLSYQLFLQLLDNKKFKILQDESNEIFFQQFSKAEIKYERDGKAVINKDFESSTKDETRHCHALDTALYTCLLLKNRIRGKNNGII